MSEMILKSQSTYSHTQIYCSPLPTTHLSKQPTDESEGRRNAGWMCNNDPPMTKDHCYRVVSNNSLRQCSNIVVQQITSEEGHLINMLILRCKDDKWT
jgi:hypothetical protein